MDIAAELLAAKPEKEARFLAMIVNKLGIFSWVEYFGYLLLGCSVITISFNICMLTLLLMPLTGLHFCVGLDFVTSSL
jgi:hypothetical protein